MRKACPGIWTKPGSARSCHLDDGRPESLYSSLQMAQLMSHLTGVPAHGSGAVGIVASAGGIFALTELLAPLPAGFPLPIILLQHLAPHGPSLLLARRAAQGEVG